MRPVAQAENMAKTRTANQAQPTVAPETKLFWAMFVAALMPVFGIISVLN